MRFGFGELVVVFIVALLVIGPNKLPAAARSLGSMLRVFKNAMGEATEEIRENVIEPLNEAQKPIREALAPVTELKQEVDKEIDSFNSSMRNLTNLNSYKAPKLPVQPVQQQDEAPAQQDAPAAAPTEELAPETEVSIPVTEEPASEAEGIATETEQIDTVSE